MMLTESGNRKIFDTHAHYDDAAFDPDREELLTTLFRSGIGAVTDAASTYESLEAIRALTGRWPHMYGAFGIHPEEIGGVPFRSEEERRSEAMPDWLLSELKGFLRGKKAVAVGEIGLDYHWSKDDKRRQITWFETQLSLAGEEKLPVVIHSRDAAADTLETARRMRIGEIGGVMHCYSYSTEMAKEYLGMGLYLGIGGVVTFKNARRLKEVVQYAPLTSLVLETDCPYLSPEPHRGSRNHSGRLWSVAKAIAAIKGVTEEEVLRTTWSNACKMYSIEPESVSPV